MKEIDVLQKQTGLIIVLHFDFMKNHDKNSNIHYRSKLWGHLQKLY